MTWKGMVGIGLFTALVAWLENEVFHATFRNTTSIHSLVGFVLSLLLILRTNTAYDRWWEGRKLWGSMLTSTRNFSTKINGLVHDPEVKQRMKILLKNFFIAAKEHLRSGVELNSLQFLNHEDRNSYETSLHIPNLIIQKLYHELFELRNNGLLSDLQINMLEQDLSVLFANLGGCERIKRTPMPYSYSLYLKKIIFLYIFTMPIGFVREFGYWAVPIVSLIFYIFTSIEILAEEIEDPFGLEANDLPTDEITNTMIKNIDEIFNFRK